MKLHTNEIRKSYKGRDVVKGVTVEVKQGEIVGLLGPNGAGKTTSFYMIVGLVKPDKGSVFIDDIDITLLQCRWKRFRKKKKMIAKTQQQTIE